MRSSSLLLCVEFARGGRQGRLLLLLLLLVVQGDQTAHHLFNFHGRQAAAFVALVRQRHEDGGRNGLLRGSLERLARFAIVLVVIVVPAANLVARQLDHFRIKHAEGFDFLSHVHEDIR